MMLEKYIYELLYTNDCVIIPDFGGFLNHKQSAVIDVIKDQIYPPRKKVGFNNQLIINDGLLVQFIKNKEQISYKEALTKVQLEVTQWKERLTLGKSIILPSLGFLSLNNEFQIVFEPLDSINFDTNSFGLNPLQIKPIESIPVQQTVEMIVHKNTLLQDSQSDIEEQIQALDAPTKSTWKKYAIAASLTFLLGLSITMISNNDTIKAQYSSFFNSNDATLLYDKASNYIAHKTVTNPVFETKEYSLDSITIDASSTNEIATIEEVKENKKVTKEVTTPQQVEIKNNTPIVTQKKEIATPIEHKIIEKQGSIILMAGAFKNLSNATNLVNTLKKSGYPKAEIIYTGNNLVSVAYAKVHNETEAITLKNTIENEGRDVWIKR